MPRRPGAYWSIHVPLGVWFLATEPDRPARDASQRFATRNRLHNVREASTIMEIVGQDVGPFPFRDWGQIPIVRTRLQLVSNGADSRRRGARFEELRNLAVVRCLSES